MGSKWYVFISAGVQILLYFHKCKLVILCQPKTGTTSLHDALAADASIAFRTPPNAKHMTYGAFRNRIAPWLLSEDSKRSKLTIISVMREPIDWFGSWYRYNAREHLSRPGTKAYKRYTGNINFDQYLECLLLPKQEAPEYARLGGPCSVALDNRGQVGVDRLYRYTDLDRMVDFIAEKLDRPLSLTKKNVSEVKELDASEATLARVRDHFAADFRIYENLSDDGSVAKLSGIRVQRG